MNLKNASLHEKPWAIRSSTAWVCLAFQAVGIRTAKVDNWIQTVRRRLATVQWPSIPHCFFLPGDVSQNLLLRQVGFRFLSWHDTQSLGIFSQLSREIVRLRGHKKLQVPVLLMELLFIPYRGAGFANWYRSPYQQKLSYYAKYQLKQLRISKDCSKALFGLFYLMKKNRRRD